MKNHELVDEYISQFSGETAIRLKTVRELVHTLAPRATEDFSYKMPAYKLDGKPLVYFAGYSHHIGFYATPNGHDAFQKEFAQFKQGKGSVQFPHDQPLPVDLIRRVIEFRISAVSGK